MQQLMGAVWSTPFRRIVTVVTAFFALIAAMGEAIKAWPSLEPYMPAHRGYVDMRVNSYKPVINQILRWQTDDTLQKIDSESAQWRIKLPSERDPQTRQMIESRIEHLEQDHAKIKARLDELSKPIK